MTRARQSMETEHPGYLGSQETYYAGNLNGVSRIHHQITLNTYVKLTFAKLYDRRNWRADYSYECTRLSISSNMSGSTSVSNLRANHASLDRTFSNVLMVIADGLTLCFTDSSQFT